MKPYIYSILFLLVIQTTYSQSKELILKDSYETNKNTILDLDIDNATIVFELSNDNKIYFDYSISFNKNSEEVQYKVYSGLKAKTSNENNKIKLEVKNSMYLGELYSLDVSMETFKEHIKKHYKKLRSNEFFYKSKDSMLKEIQFSIGSNTDDYFKKLKLNNPNKNYGSSARKYKQHFTIKVPKDIKIKIKALHSKINFTFDIYSTLEIDSFKTYYKFKKVKNDNNKFKIMNGIFQAEEIFGGSYNFKDFHKVRIGSVENVVLKTESIKVQIGEVKDNVVFKDFDSKIHLYNFKNSFKTFDFEGEYTKLNFYKVKDTNYAMDVFGYNTVLKMDNNTTSFGDAEEKKLTKILQKKPKENVKPSGNIAIELKNGILNIN